ncbi:hypothetical protein AAG747_22765 [Rapidithrix thailandica]|uniref:Uncharacterized protein n=1 Tax=Rapidithrix thailandica TaxID=413964 RepID=A0AAW9SJ86_9BACT
MKQVLLIALLFSAQFVNAQVIKLDNGIAFSSFRNKKDLPMLSNSIKNYFVSVGIDFLEKKWFYLSSQIGYVKLGGKETNEFLDKDLRDVKSRTAFVHITTTFRMHPNRDKANFFVGLGPYVNILSDQNTIDVILYKDYTIENIHFGGKAELWEQLMILIS